MDSTQSRQITQQLLDLAIQQTTALLLILPKADAKWITREVFFQVWNKFREHDHPLISLSVLEIADNEFAVRANVHATATLMIQRKEASNG